MVCTKSHVPTTCHKTPSKVQLNKTKTVLKSKCRKEKKITQSELAEKLREEIRLLMDISGEVRDAYRGKLDAKQNKNMNMLTIITALCTPLTVTCAWYGMNFNSMPEFDWTYGYLGFIILNIIVISVGVLFLKKKKIM